MLSFDLLGGITLLLQEGGGGLLTSPLSIIVIIALIAGGIYLARQTGNKSQIAEGLNDDADPSVSRQVSALMKRYKDSYLVARVIVGLGNTIKTVGFILAALIFFGAFIFGNLAAQQSGIGSREVSGGVFFAVLVIGAINAFIVGFVFYVIGVIVSANGQVLKATLDNTVGNSPFLANDLKAKIMSLPEA